MLYMLYKCLHNIMSQWLWIYLNFSTWESIIIRDFSVDQGVQWTSPTRCTAKAKDSGASYHVHLQSRSHAVIRNAPLRHVTCTGISESHDRQAPFAVRYKLDSRCNCACLQWLSRAHVMCKWIHSLCMIQCNQPKWKRGPVQGCCGEHCGTFCSMPRPGVKRTACWSSTSFRIQHML